MSARAKPPTPAQNAARKRNWRIRRLRGLYAQVSMLTGSNRDMAEVAIDEELASIGAEREAVREARRRGQYREEIPENEIPY